MTVNKIDATLFKKMFMNGAINLKNHYEEIDRLNVFPIPDGDTGTNMQMTMMHGVNQLSHCDSTSIIEVARLIADSLFDSSRGNSGVILGSFFKGLYMGIRDVEKTEVTVLDFIKSLLQASKVAYQAVDTPVEGTILTVIRLAANKVNELKDEIQNVNQLFDIYIEAAKEALERTPEMLPVLKEAGVVDSGGAGFIKVIDGMNMALKGQMLEVQLTTPAKVTQDVLLNHKEIKYGYCTEFILELKLPNDFLETDLRTPYNVLGDSLVIVKNGNFVKVHVHTNRPGRVLDIAQKYGEFTTTKIENMRLQHSQFIVENKTEKIQEKKKYGIIAVCFGNGIKKTFEALGVDYVIDGGQTMNPPTEAFLKAIKIVNADNVIIVPNNSNVILSAEQAAKICSHVNAKVLPAKTIAQGYASLMMFDQTEDIQTNYDQMTKAILKVNSGEITYAVRNTEINGVKIHAGDYMGIANGKIVCSTTQRIDATKSLLEKCIKDDSEIVTFFYGNNVSQDEICELETYCQEINDEIEVELIEGNQDIYSYIIAVE